MRFFDFTSGILGMNARNNLYLRPFNTQKAVNLADSKLGTKQFLSARGIPVPKLYSTVDKEADLLNFDLKQLPENVVLKPNMGFGGGGIIPFQSKNDEGMVKMSGEVLSYPAVKEHMADILAGRFSISGAPDRVFFEQRIVCHPSLEPYTYKGLPDIRIIVHQLVPVMAMLRLPSKESDGRANLSQGAYGVGIDIGRGICTHTVYKDKLIQEIPGIGSIKGFALPFWDEILYIASSIQKLTNLGYLAVDIAIDKSGPMLLEINARPGLSIQVANMAPLKARLDRVRGLKIQTPEKGVRIAKELFGQKLEKIVREETGRQVLGLKEDFEILRKNEKHILRAKLDPWHKESEIFRPMVSRLGLKLQEDGLYVKIKGILGTERFVSLFRVVDDLTEETPVRIGKRDLKNILIDPNKTSDKKVSLPKLNTSHSEGTNLGDSTTYEELYTRILKLESKLKILHYLNPINVESEKKAFSEGRIMNPSFEYRSLSFDTYAFEKEIHAIEMLLKDDVKGRLLAIHMKALREKIFFIRSIQGAYFEEAAQLIYGKISEEATLFGKKTLQNFLKEDVRANELHDERWELEEIINYMDAYLKKTQLSHWRVEVLNTIGASFSVNHTSQVVFLKKTNFFRKNRLDLSIAHEIDVHVFTHENGAKQPFPLLKKGLGHYLKTQEGLAIMAQILMTDALIPKHGTFLRLAAYQKLARDLDFRTLYERILKEEQLDANAFSSKVFSICTRLKRGLVNQNLGGTNYKSGIYLQGFYEIYKAYQAGLNLQDLFVGKYDLKDHTLVQQLDLEKEGLRIPPYIQDSSRRAQRLSWIDSSN